jgi:hypothetical protein
VPCARVGAPAVPRWASTNLGVFICTNCSVRRVPRAARKGASRDRLRLTRARRAVCLLLLLLLLLLRARRQGIHRGLGVHISKVRSCALDKWTPELVSNMENIGNQRANAYWERNVPGTVVRPREGDMKCGSRAACCAVRVTGARWALTSLLRRRAGRWTAGFGTSMSWATSRTGASAAARRLQLFRSATPRPLRPSHARARAGKKPSRTASGQGLPAARRQSAGARRRRRAGCAAGAAAQAGRAGAAAGSGAATVAGGVQAAHGWCHCRAAPRRRSVRGLAGRAGRASARGTRGARRGRVGSVRAAGCGGGAARGCARCCD